MAFRFGDFGLGFDDDARRQAMRSALVDAGLTIMGKASTEGFGGLDDGFGAFVSGYRGNLERMDEEREERRRQALEEELRRERLASLAEGREDRADRRADREAGAAAREEERAARKAALEQIEDNKVRGELELRIAQPNFWEVLDKRTASPKAPETRNFSDGTTRVWDPVAGDWRVESSKPPKAEKGDDYDTGFAAAGRILGDSAASMEAARKAALKRADAEITRIRKENEKGEAEPLPLPDRMKLANSFLLEELEGTRFERGLPAPVKPGATAPALSRPAAAPASARDLPSASAPTAAGPSPATPEQSQELAQVIERRISSLGLPPQVAQMRKSQILGRVRELLARGHTPEEILAELR